MRKSFVMIVAVALVAVLAVPATAEVSLNGFYRAKGYMTNYFRGTNGDITNSAVQISADAHTNSYIDQRYRAKFTAGDENVKAVSFFEFNGLWGKAPADLSADKAELRVKNCYLWFKVPDTAVDVTVGLQGISDAYAGVFSGAADVAGVYANYKASETLSLRAGFAVPYTDGVTTENDGNAVLYQAEAKFAASKDLKIGANLYYLKDTSDTAADEAAIWMPGVDFTANLGSVGLTGFAFYQFGELSDTVDQAAFAADIRADVAAGTAKIFGEVLYTSGNGDGSADEYNGVVVLDAGADFATGSSTYGRNSTYIIMPAADSIGTAAGLTYDVDNHGDGLLLLQAGAAVPFTSKLTGKFNAAYAMATDAPSGVDDAMGIEVNATAEYNVAKGLDVAATGAYCFLGDYVTGGADADDPFALVAKVNYAF